MGREAWCESSVPERQVFCIGFGQRSAEFSTATFLNGEKCLEPHGETWLFTCFVFSQQQNALGYNLSMQGIGTVAIDGPRFEEFLRSRKDFFEVSQGGVSQGGLARILLLGCTAWLIFLMLLDPFSL